MVLLWPQTVSSSAAFRGSSELTIGLMKGCDFRQFSISSELSRGADSESSLPSRDIIADSIELVSLFSTRSTGRK
jgi:hypothetical protein